MKTIIIDGITYKLVPVDGKTTQGATQLATLESGKFNIGGTFKVVKNWGYRNFDNKDGTTGSVLNLLIGDDSGTVKLVLWGNLAEKAQDTPEGASITITKCYSKDGQERVDGTRYVELHSGKNSEVSVVWT